MKRDANPPLRPGFREAWEARSPPHEPTDRVSDGSPDTGYRRECGARPTHLVLTNDAGRREEILLGVAGRLAKGAGAAVRVAHLHASPMGELEVVRRLSPAGRAADPVADICDRLFLAARSLAGRTGWPVTPELLVGPADPTLTEYVRVNEFDLVTASAGNTWLSLWAGGSWFEVARRRPVLVVGPGVSGSWADCRGPTGGLLAILDGTVEAEEALAPAVGLCRLLDARLTLLRVRPANGAGHSADRCHRYLLGVGRLVRRHVPAVRAIVTTGRAADAILNVQRATGAVVSLAAPTRSWLASFTPGRLGVRVLRGSTAPVLFYRPAL